ncbi:MAG: mechanosensitive ion channel domain-containing protein [Verrucomicrobiota bacterium]
METLEIIYEAVDQFLPFVIGVVVVGISLWVAHHMLIGRHTSLGNEKKFARQLVMLGLTLLGLIVIIQSLPLSDPSRNKLVGLVGILLSGIIAFSSTSIFANLAAGLLLRITKPFRTGDFIQVGDHFGRVSERGLFDTEIQSETRELIALPNMYCINNPVTTVRSSGTIVSASLSLGYDIDHARVESLLLVAAKKAELEEPFVHILELGDFSVTYRVSGFLTETRIMISARSKLRGYVLDVLHGEGIEIMSPNYMNQRQLGDGPKAIPESVPLFRPKKPVGSAETLAFDKAERAEELEKVERRLLGEIDSFKSLIKEATDEEEKKRIEAKMDQTKQLLSSLDEIRSQEKKAED